MTEAIAGLMPNLKTKQERARGMKHYGLFDFIRSFGQLAVAEESREMLSYMTDERVFSRTVSCKIVVILLYIFKYRWRIVPRSYGMNTCSSGLMIYYFCGPYCPVPLGIGEIVRPRARVWTEVEFEEVFALSAVCDVVLESNRPEWHSSRPEEDRGTHSYAAAADGRAASTVHLRDQLDARFPDRLCTRGPAPTAVSGRGVERQAQDDACCIGDAVDLNEEEVNSFNQVKMLLQQSAQLAYPRDGATFCLFVDASDVGWASILTQVAAWKPGVAVTDQSYELLFCKGGTFHGAQKHWHVIEKEGYPIVLLCEDLDYVLLRPGGFKVFVATATSSTFSPLARRLGST